MSSLPGLLPPPKKKRNPKALQLTAESLAPPAADDEQEQPILVADLPVGPNRNQVPELSTSSAASTPSSRSSLSPSEPCVAAAPPGSIGRASGISRKKPMGLDISKSIPTRPAPVPGTKSKRDSGVRLSSSSKSDKPRGSYQQKLSEQLVSMDLGGGSGKTKKDLRTEDLKVVGELGSGNGGTVAKVLHVPSGLFMARKLVLIDAKPSVRKQILRELQIMHDCSSDTIVTFYGAFMADPHIVICMEHMDRGSLDNIYREHGPVDIDIVGKIAFAVLEGLVYLYDVHRIIHRDVKPSNILVNSSGQIKLCDFGVSGELINSIANTFVGTSTYMSPERIQGAPYTVKSDVWSLGISLIELALGRFPFADSDADSDLSEPDDNTIHSSDHAGPLPPRTAKPTTAKDKRKSNGVSLGGGGMTMSILDLLQHIVNEPAPKLGEPHGDDSVQSRFIDATLLKDPEARQSPHDLLNHPWMSEIKSKTIDLEAWASKL